VEQHNVKPLNNLVLLNLIRVRTLCNPAAYLRPMGSSSLAKLPMCKLTFGASRSEGT
jgi:hypothetical protein